MARTRTPPEQPLTAGLLQQLTGLRASAGAAASLSCPAQNMLTLIRCGNAKHIGGPAAQAQPQRPRGGVARTCQQARHRCIQVGRAAADGRGQRLQRRKLCRGRFPQARAVLLGRGQLAWGRLEPQQLACGAPSCLLPVPLDIQLFHVLQLLPLRFVVTAGMQSYSARAGREALNAGQ